MKFYYENHKGEIIDFSKPPYLFQKLNFFDWEYSYDNDGIKTSRFYKKPREFKGELMVFSINDLQNTSKETMWEQAINDLQKILAVDVINNKNGKLHTDNGDYLSCKIIASEKKEWNVLNNFVRNDLTILTDLPFWINEQKVIISPISEELIGEGEEGIKTYPYTYPYRYPLLQTETLVDVEHYTDSDFKLIVYGPTTSVNIEINNHPYIVEYPLEKGEHMVIDSRKYVPKEERLYVVRTNGEKENIFNYRGVEHSVFQKIPYGQIKIDYPRTYGLELTIFKERSEPPWKS